MICLASWLRTKPQATKIHSKKQMDANVKYVEKCLSDSFDKTLEALDYNTLTAPNLIDALSMLSNDVFSRFEKTGYIEASFTTPGTLKSAHLVLGTIASNAPDGEEYWKFIKNIVKSLIDKIPEKEAIIAVKNIMSIGFYNAYTDTIPREEIQTMLEICNPKPSDPDYF